MIEFSTELTDTFTYLTPMYYYCTCTEDLRVGLGGVILLRMSILDAGTSDCMGKTELAGIVDRGGSPALLRTCK